VSSTAGAEHAPGAREALQYLQDAASRIAADAEQLGGGGGGGGGTRPGGRDDVREGGGKGVWGKGVGKGGREGAFRAQSELHAALARFASEWSLAYAEAARNGCVGGGGAEVLGQALEVLAKFPACLDAHVSSFVAQVLLALDKGLEVEAIKAPVRKMFV
jgi:hypothetical protein